MASFAGDEPRLPPPRRTRSLEMPHGINKKPGFSEIAAAAAANAAKEYAGGNMQNQKYSLNNMYGGYDAISDAAILHERLSALREGAGVSHMPGQAHQMANNIPPHFFANNNNMNNNQNLIPGGPVNPIDRMPSLVSWGQTLTVDPSKGGLSLRNNPGVPPLPPSSPQTPSRNRPNNSPFAFNEGDNSNNNLNNSYAHPTGLPPPPPPPPRSNWGTQHQMGGNLIPYSNSMGHSNYASNFANNNMGEIPWANGGQDRVPSLLARTSSAPPLGGMMKLGDIMKGGDMNDLHIIYRNVSEASTPDISPSRSPLTVQSAASSPERERRPNLPMGLPRTKLSRTSSCPPLGDVLEDSELLSTESDGDGEVGSSGQDGKHNLILRNKRKRPIPVPEGFPKGRSTPPREGQRSPTNSQKSAGDRTESKGDDDDGDDEENDHLSPEDGGGGLDIHTMRQNRKKDDKDKKLDPPKDYIHVRARRGQATDSHSLAERVRREKISERMKVLQDLVPTCSKVTGKALMLDEIINYVRSLQLQVELLSRKLAAIGHEAEVSNMSEGSHSLQPDQQPQQHQQDIVSDTKSASQAQGSIDLGAFQQQQIMPPVTSASHDGNNNNGRGNGGMSSGSFQETSGMSGGSMSQSEMRNPGMDNLGSVSSLEMHLNQGGMLQDMLLGSTRGLEDLAIDHFQTADVMGDLHPNVNMNWDGDINTFVDCNQLQPNIQGDEHGIYVKQEF